MSLLEWHPHITHLAFAAVLQMFLALGDVQSSACQKDPIFDNPDAAQCCNIYVKAPSMVLGSTWGDVPRETQLRWKSLHCDTWALNLRRARGDDRTSAFGRRQGTGVKLTDVAFTREQFEFDPMPQVTEAEKIRVPRFGREAEKLRVSSGLNPCSIWADEAECCEMYVWLHLSGERASGTNWTCRHGCDNQFHVRAERWRQLDCEQFWTTHGWKEKALRGWKDKDSLTQRQCVARAIRGGMHSEASPLIVPGTLLPGPSGRTHPSLVICRVPKADSLVVRSVVASKIHGTPFHNVGNRVGRIHHARTLYPLLGMMPLTRAFEMLRDSNRIMFVRHPVARTLSGWRTIYPKGTVDEFAQFVRVDFPRHYDASCGKFTLDMAREMRIQHWAPAQHCRCGIPCGIRYTFYKIEDVKPENVLQHYWGEANVNVSWLKHTHTDSRPAGPNKADFLQPTVLATLNRVTAEEQAYFGYSAFKI